jgi:hypothetical protein
MRGLKPSSSIGERNGSMRCVRAGAGIVETFCRVSALGKLCVMPGSHTGGGIASEGLKSGKPTNEAGMPVWPFPRIDLRQHALAELCEMLGDYLTRLWRECWAAHKDKTTDPMGSLH